MPPYGDDTEPPWGYRGEVYPDSPHVNPRDYLERGYEQDPLRRYGDYQAALGEEYTRDLIDRTERYYDDQRRRAHADGYGDSDLTYVSPAPHRPGSACTQAYRNYYG